MTLTTILLDLDNTLLGNDMSQFLPAYFIELEKRLRPFIGDQNLQTLMYASVQSMQANETPEVTNMAAFMADFCRRLKVAPETINPVLDQFYQTEYLALQQHTTHRAAAAATVNYLLSAGCTVVVATNPLFPEVAIRRRLAWAGLSDVDFALITTMENSCFSKPHPAYYRQILAQVDSQPAQALMVGDDLELDIEPAHALGMQTWWITDHLPAPPAQQPAVCDQMGSLAEFLAWIKTQDCPAR